MFSSVKVSEVLMFWRKESTRLHHEASANGVKGVRYDAGKRGDCLRNGPARKEAGALVVPEQVPLGRVVQAKVRATVDDDALQSS